MKKIISLILSLTIFCSFFIPASATSKLTEDEIKSILNVMNIMTYDKNGNFNDGQHVSRAALAKILVNSSQYKGIASSSSRISPFPDVLYTHWGASYISVALKNKFMTGYSDGTFRPDKNILFEEAFSAILRLLGYTNEDYTAPYPIGQISKAEDIGLSDGVNFSAGKPIPRNEMAKLIYNLLNTPAKGEAAFYATKLGYTLSSEFLTIGDVFKDNVEGPLTVKPETLANLGFTATHVYRNGETAKISDIENFDVIYYSKTTSSIWAYSKKVSGILSNISPNKETPTSVTVSGVTYQLNYYAAQRAFGLDGFAIGETVTMLLDKNGNVCDAYRASDIYESIIGVMTGVSTKTITAIDGTKVTGYYASILTTDGSTLEVERPSNSESYVGKAVTVDINSGNIRSYSPSAKTVSGYIHADTYMIGNTPITGNLKIIEIDDNGNTISPTIYRLDGVNLDSSSVLLASKNASGAIDGLILKNVTGDMHKYGLITDIQTRSTPTSEGGQNITKTYTYDLGGTRGNISFPRTTISLTEGPCVFMYKDGEILDAKNLIREEKVSLLTPEYATTSTGAIHKISPNVLVYKVVGDSRILTDLDEAISHDGTIWIYYDNIQSAGGLVRVIYIK